MEKLGKIFHPKDAKVFMDEQELVREYLHTDKCVISHEGKAYREIEDALNEFTGK